MGKILKAMGIGSDAIGSEPTEVVESVEETVEVVEPIEAVETVEVTETAEIQEEASGLVGRSIAGKLIISDEAIEELNLRRIVDEDEATFILSQEEIEAYVR